MVYVGEYALWLGLALSAFGAAVSILGGVRRDGRLIRSGRNALIAVAALTVLASAILVRALLMDDFQLSYVATHSERALPALYKLAAFWGGQAGSILFWQLILVIYALAALRSLFPTPPRRKDAKVPRRKGINKILAPFVPWRLCVENNRAMAYFVAVVLLNTGFFFFLMLFGSNANPFALLDFVPKDGTGLDPLLQNAWMIVHPLGLYLGYAGFTIPFAYAAAVLASGERTGSWTKDIRRWTLIPWAFLTLGIVLGMRWSYTELGWGGYWGWDPVENASLIPWLTATAFFHSLMIEERRGMLKVWNVFLIFLTYILTMFGTFVTRSGVVESVHVFARSNIGLIFAIFIGLATIGSLHLFFERAPMLRSRNRMDSILSRESVFMYQNLVFVALAGATLLGTVFPTISDLFLGQKVSVDAPFFYKVDGPLFGLMLLLMGLAPLMKWRRTDVRGLVRALAAPTVGAIATIVAASMLGAKGVPELAGFGLAGFVAAVVLQEFRRGIASRRMHRRESILTSLYRLFRRGRQRYGGYVVHLGVVVMAIGILASTAYEKDVQVNLEKGQSVRVAGYTISYEGLRWGQGRNYQSAYAVLEVSKGGRTIGRITPARRIYDKSPDQPTSEVGLLSGFTGDFYVVLAGWENGGARAFFEIYVHPLMGWIWAGAALMLLGMAIALWPEPAPAYADVRVPAAAEAAR